MHPAQTDIIGIILFIVPLTKYCLEKRFSILLTTIIKISSRGMVSSVRMVG